MKKAFAIVAGSVMPVFGLAGTAEFEQIAASALTNAGVLVSCDFSNLVSRAESDTNEWMRIDAALVKSVIHFQMYLDLSDVNQLSLDYVCVTSAVHATEGRTNLWQFWSSRLLLSGVEAARENFAASFVLATNCAALVGADASGLATNRLAMAVSRYYELPESDFAESFKVLAGMSAAQLGNRSEAIKYASQVSTKYGTLIHRFMDEEP